MCLPLMTSDARAVHNYTQKADDRTEEERKRDHRNALRRASYRRKKQPNVRDEIAMPLVLTGMVSKCF
jgi:hypothetical protein